MRAIRERLREMYGVPVNEPNRRPIDELVLTILSQHTNDRNSGRAFKLLRERFPTWDEVRDAPVGEVEDAIRPGGLAQQKAPRIQAILRAAGRRSRASTGPRTAPLEESREYLLSLPGVGRKTAACVLIFSWGLPEIPVDVHIHRVGGRLGLFPAKASLERAHDEMLALVAARGRLRAARQPDPPRAHALPPETALRRVRAAPDVPLVPGPRPPRADRRLTARTAPADGEPPLGEPGVSIRAASP